MLSTQSPYEHNTGSADSRHSLDSIPSSNNLNTAPSDRSAVKKADSVSTFIPSPIVPAPEIALSGVSMPTVKHGTFPKPTKPSLSTTGGLPMRFSLILNDDGTGSARLSPSIITRCPLPILNLPTLVPETPGASAVPSTPLDEEGRRKVERIQSKAKLRAMPALPLRGSSSQGSIHPRARTVSGSSSHTQRHNKARSGSISLMPVRDVDAEDDSEESETDSSDDDEFQDAQDLDSPDLSRVSIDSSSSISTTSSAASYSYVVPSPSDHRLQPSRDVVSRPPRPTRKPPAAPTSPSSTRRTFDANKTPGPSFLPPSIVDTSRIDLSIFSPNIDGGRDKIRTDGTTPGAANGHVRRYEASAGTDYFSFSETSTSFSTSDRRSPSFGALSPPNVSPQSRKAGQGRWNTVIHSISNTFPV